MIHGNHVRGNPHTSGSILKLVQVGGNIIRCTTPENQKALNLNVQRKTYAAGVYSYDLLPAGSKEASITMTHRWLMMTALSLLCFVGCNPPSPRMGRLELFRHPGVQWFSWTSTERENFVFGYTQGFADGAYLACRSADNLFEKDKPHDIGNDKVPSTYPSARCSASIDGYSNIKVIGSGEPDFSSYTDAITSFYRKYPEYRDVHYINLIAHLAGTQQKTADDLYSLAKEGKLLHPPEKSSN